jgi:hypothetical protein
MALARPLQSLLERQEGRLGRLQSRRSAHAESLAEARAEPQHQSARPEVTRPVSRLRREGGALCISKMGAPAG